jgi:hypothetical protein
LRAEKLRLLADDQICLPGLFFDEDLQFVDALPDFIDMAAIIAVWV